MSSIYIQEPPTDGKVLLKTSAGEIDIELWSKEAPKACRNFIQLCMEGYYDNTIFHRVVPDFIVQGGDPTGTGEGGESSYGRPFKDEFHSRLRFVRRGLVAMANAGADDNGSQFFFTLGRADELNNKHTIFGKVTGDTVYNMLRLAEVECDAQERPLRPHKVRSARVLHCPFDDVTPRETERDRKARQREEEGNKASQSRATKNFSLLSFGEEAEEEEATSERVSQTFKAKGKSSHDLLKDDPRLSAVPAVDASECQAETSAGEKTAEKKTTEEEKETEEEKKSSRSEELRKEVRQLKRELQALRRKKDETTKAEEENEAEEEKPSSAAVAEYLAGRRKYEETRKQEKKKGRSREEQTMALLDRFKTKLSSAITEATPMPEGEELEEDDDTGWLSHVLQFDEHSGKVKDANVQDEDTFEIYDPRNPVTKRRREESKKKMAEKKRRR